MGSSCCHAESPCGSEEEKSVLLKGESKALVPTGEKVMVGTCGPEDNGIRITPDGVNIKVEVKTEAVQMKQSPEVGETAPNNAQESEPLLGVIVTTAPPSPRQGSEPRENATAAQDEDAKDRPADGGRADLLQCTLNSPEERRAAADWEVFTATPEEENPASAPGVIPDVSSLTAETACPEDHTETKAAGEHATSTAARDNDGAAGEASWEDPQNDDALSVPTTRLPAAGCPLSPISVVSQEVDAESQSRTVPEDPECLLCKESGSEVIEGRGASESSSGSEAAGLSHSGEEPGSRSRVREAETAAPEDSSESSTCDQDAKPEVSGAAASSEATSSEHIKQDVGAEMTLKVPDRDGDAPTAEESDEMKEEAESAPTEARGPAGGDAEIQEVTGEEGPQVGSSPTGGKAHEIAVTETEGPAEDGLGNSEEDLYRGAEELSAPPEHNPGPPHVLETTHAKMEDRCSLAPATDTLSYSEREWRGNTAKSALIRKGYKEMSQRFGSLRRVRGDNYCALRATLFQVLAQSSRLPSWLQEEDVAMLPNQLGGLVSRWTFPGECLQGDGTGDATVQLKGYMELLRNKWQAAVDCSSAVERRRLCERVFQGGEEELGLLEALKLLMLGRAVELHGRMQAGEDVPLFCWLLFARDSSDCPHAFLSNHLGHVGLSAGLEQVEMFLLGYALQCTIQVYRLYKADTEEFVTYYPDDHKDAWPSVCLVTEDDRHYNVPIAGAAEHKELDSS